jgi:membrane-associated phospholipid phosphatase
VEARLFRGQPSMFLSERFPWVGLSEALHACYLGLYLLIPLPAVLLLTQRREREAARAVFALSLCLFFLMLFWIWLPVTSPLYRYPLIHGPQASGFFFRLAHRVSRQGGVLGAAFPSGHAALASLALLICWRWIRKAFWIVLGPTFGLLAATVYCRYHFALDTLAGILVGAAAYLLLVGRRRASVAPPIGATATSISTGRGGRPIR